MKSFYKAPSSCETLMALLLLAKLTSTVFSGKLSRISRFCGYTQKFSPRNLGRGVLWRCKSEQSAKVFSTKIKFSSIRESFSLESFPLYDSVLQAMKSVSGLVSSMF